MSSTAVVGTRHPWLQTASAVTALLVALPVLALGIIAFTGSGDDWPHILRNVLPGSAATTLWLLALVSAATAIIGVFSAYVIASCEFPFRRTLSWAIVLPLAVPPYLAAYALGEFFHYTGPVQSLIREIFGFQTTRDYWFPNIRSTEGAALVMTSVLYPYVYLTARVVFLMQGRSVADAARTLGAGRARTFFKVLLPLARPAIVAGVALVLMETLNDIGASEYLGVRTLTFSVYSTWLNRGSLAGGAQIALVLLAIVAALLIAESWARRKQRYAAQRSSQLKARPPRQRLHGLAAVGVPTLLLLPMLIGFGIPLYVFARYAVRRIDQLFARELTSAFLNSVLTATLTALFAVVIAGLLIYASRYTRSRAVPVEARIASMGYALPGGILALGLLFVLGRLDNTIDTLARSLFGLSTGLIFTGSAAAVIIACTIRFIALAEGAVRSGHDKLPPNIEAAARSLGRTAGQSARTILLPLLTPAILTAAVLVFVDTIKELSATILLRPFGFNTLATYVYEQASRGAPEDGAFAALLIVVTALVPVAILSRMLADDRST
ncbi:MULTISPECIES: ABC transporter permease [Mesorhizobium]|uniref:Iron ABC transporter permease n=1 Tax=Mesorhizobium denitrificans TaxID=2294114 RepID=A0A371XCU9_9HYPH|nr:MULTISPECIES: iron ABC transporter permease [Mesorhizobium]RFC67057.1 iron ABC transporter permease [Mesorhizobium denitrificans]